MRAIDALDVAREAMDAVAFQEARDEIERLATLKTAPNGASRARAPSPAASAARGAL